MNLTELYSLVGTIAAEKPNVNSYFPTSPYIAWQNRSIDYASVAFTVESVRDDENVRTYNCLLYYGDRLLQDGSNWIAVQDNATNTLWSIIEDLRGQDEIEEVEYDYQIQYFNQRMSDYLAGAYVEININVAIDNCLEY